MKSIQDLIFKLHKTQKTNNINEEIKILFELGLKYLDKNELDKSKSNFNKILNINKNIIEVNYYLGIINIQKGNFSKAKQYLKRELKNNPNNYDCINLIEKIEINENFPIITLTLFFLNSIIFYFTYPKISFEYLVRYGININYFTISKLFSSIFFHINLLHFLTNMIILLMFGLILEKKINSIKFLFLFLISAVVGNFIQAIYIPNSFVIGASAGLFGIIGGIVILDPLLKVRILGIIKFPIIIIFGGFFIFSNLFSNYLEIGLNSGNLAHLIGFIIGLLFITFFYNNSFEVLYYLSAISFGFYIISLGLDFIIKGRIHENLDIFLILVYIGFGIFLIILIYDQLKQIIKIKNNNINNKIEVIE